MQLKKIKNSPISAQKHFGPKSKRGLQAQIWNQNFRITFLEIPIPFWWHQNEISLSSEYQNWNQNGFRFYPLRYSSLRRPIWAHGLHLGSYRSHLAWSMAVRHRRCWPLVLNSRDKILSFRSHPVSQIYKSNFHFQTHSNLTIIINSNFQIKSEYQNKIRFIHTKSISTKTRINLISSSFLQSRFQTIQFQKTNAKTSLFGIKHNDRIPLGPHQN